MRPDGSRLEAVASTQAPTGQATQPRWTPDGASIVYSHVPLGEISPRQFWVMDADGANDRPLLVTWDDYIHPVMRP
jgi:Tol biopolymer transport system component